MPPIRLDFTHAERAVRCRARQDHADWPGLAARAGQQPEERIDRGVLRPVVWTAAEVEMAVDQLDLRVGRDDVDAVRPDARALGGIQRPSAGCAAQQRPSDALACFGARCWTKMMAMSGLPA